MEPYHIIISILARKDLIELFNYIAEHDAPGKADILSEELSKKIDDLSLFPERGRNIYKYSDIDFYAIYYKVYQITYAVMDNNVTIASVLDARRDLKKILPRRFADFMSLKP